MKKKAIHIYKYHQHRKEKEIFNLEFLKSGTQTIQLNL